MKVGQAQLPEGWEIKSLGDLYDITSSKRVFQDEWKSSGVPFYRAREIVKLAQNGFVDNELFISDEMYNEYSNKYGIPKVGDIMVTGVGTLGICYLVKSKDKFYFKDGNIIWLKTKGNVNSRYVEYAFKSDYLRKQIDDSVGATVGTYTIIKANSTKIPLPPLPEQQRIVSILDEAFAAIAKAKANAEQNLKNAKELFESYLQGVFENGDWEMKTLNEVAKVFGRGKSKHRPRNWEGLYGGDYPFIQTGEVRNANKFISNYTQTYNEIGLAQSKLWKKGTICITIAANIAETAILDFDACIPDSIIGFEVDAKKADLNFAYYLLQYFKAELQKLGKGSAQDNINLGTFENQYFPFPSLKEQQTIVRRLDALRAETQKLEAIYQKKLDDLEELKKSILQKAFSGELKTERGVEV